MRVRVAGAFPQHLDERGEFVRANTERGDYLIIGQEPRIVLSGGDSHRSILRSDSALSDGDEVPAVACFPPVLQQTRYKLVVVSLPR